MRRGRLDLVLDMDLTIGFTSPFLLSETGDHSCCPDTIALIGFVARLGLGMNLSGDQVNMIETHGCVRVLGQQDIYDYRLTFLDFQGLSHLAAIELVAKITVKFAAHDETVTRTQVIGQTHRLDFIRQV